MAPWPHLIWCLLVAKVAAETPLPDPEFDPADWFGELS